MTDRIHVIASFDSTDDLLAAMRRSKSWIKLEEATVLSALATEESLKLVLCTDRDGDGPWYSEREVELAVQVWRDYPQAIAEAHATPSGCQPSSTSSVSDTDASPLSPEPPATDA